MKDKNPVKRVVVDEGVSAAQLARFSEYAEERGLHITDYLHIRDQHPGMPDNLILQHHLHKETILITTDRPFHNTTLSRGIASYYLGEETITGSPLRGIRVSSEPPRQSKEPIKESYHLPTTPVRESLLPDSLRQLKKLRTKRRRIRNHFGGLDNIAQIAVTVSWTPLGARTLIGIQVQASAVAGMKAINACESYPAEELEPAWRGLAALCHALALVIQLSLNTVPTILYYDAHRIADPLKEEDVADDHPYRHLFENLKNEFRSLELSSPSKGRHLEGLRQKLKQLTTTDTNEITPGNLAELVKGKGSPEK